MSNNELSNSTNIEAKSVDLFTPVQLGPYELPNRIVMAPMTRNRASDTFVPSSISETYYAQRASAGLIITEASQVSPQGAGYPRTPGIYNEEQIEAWRRITEAIHCRGGRVFLQLWHAGRISHPSVLPNGILPISPSSKQAKGKIMTNSGMQDYVLPRAVDTAEIPELINQFRNGAMNAMKAGFDGVEVHAANGYLLDQFIRDNPNEREDDYGGSVENRVRLLMEVTAAVTDVWGSDRVGVRISPLVNVHSVFDSDPEATFGYLVAQLNSFRLAYLHAFESVIPSPHQTRPHFDTKKLRQAFRGTYIANGGYDANSANKALAGQRADLVSFASLFISNPDLPQRFKENAPLRSADIETFYQGDEKGYTDYPSMNP